jgi:hypothetical protein
LLWVEGDSVAILHEGQLTRGTGSRIAGFIKRRSERPPHPLPRHDWGRTLL